MSGYNRAQIEADPCECVKCAVCNGSGTYWMTISGRYIGISRCDDLDELEHCEFCDGGYTEVCGRCQILAEFDIEDDDYD